MDRAALPPLDQADYDILENHLRARILDSEAVRGWERNPNTWLNTASFAFVFHAHHQPGLFAPLWTSCMRPTVSSQ